MTETVSVTIIQKQDDQFLVDFGAAMPALSQVGEFCTVFCTVSQSVQAGKGQRLG